MEKGERKQESARLLKAVFEQVVLCSSHIWMVKNRVLLDEHEGREGSGSQNRQATKAARLRFQRETFRA